MNTIQITAEQNLALQKLSFNPSWYVVQNEGQDVQGFESRAKARAYNTNGRIYDARDFGSKVVFEVIAPVVAETPAVEPKAKTPKIPVTRESTIERPCKQVWHIADAMAEKAGGFKNLRRKDVLAYCVANGIAFYTARTQYQLWLTIQNGGSI